MRLIDIDNITALDIMHNVTCDTDIARKMLEFLQEQPTAYDVDKVVEKLELNRDAKLFLQHIPAADLFASNYAYDDAIKIVKAGGQK